MDRRQLAGQRATRVLLEAVESSEGGEEGWHNKADDERLPLQRHPNLTPGRRKQTVSQRAGPGTASGRFVDGVVEERSS